MDSTDGFRQTGPEPIAVVGMACRFAGGLEGPEDFWDFMITGREAVGTVPDSRWAPYRAAGPAFAAALRGATKYGSFLDDVEGFDADFFGITPREAALMDPQQRLVLELSWEALEHAGIPPTDLAGSDTGVFVGIGADDYGRRLLEDLPRIEAWTGIGGAFCAAANRVSYTLDLRGPSIALDTACSSSLVSVHLACQSLRARECPVALAGGVLVIAGPGLTLVLDAAGATSADGRSKSFDASADGYGRGEGAGMVVLKRLADARRDGDRVFALIRGGAVHQDGRTNGIMAPSAPAQEHLMRRAYAAAGVDPRTIDYVEAHGTGTPTGDPVEARAISAVVGASRAADAPCLIGSVKANIGHLEAGAGIAGVIKTVPALYRGVIPPSRNHAVPNPAIDWETNRLSVVTTATPWPRTGRPRRAAVSGFGYGGTIAHLVLEEGDREQDKPSPALVPPEQAQERLRVFPLSGATEAGVRDYAGRLADWLDAPRTAAPIDSVQYTLARRRTALPERAAVVADGARGLAEGLRALAAGDPHPNVVTGRRREAPPGGGLVWVFSGHGAQWPAMAREHLAEEPVFAEVIDKLGQIYLDEMGFTPRQVIERGRLGGVDVIQSVIYAVQVGLAAATTSAALSGDRAAVEALAARFEAAGERVRRIDSDVAFHSTHMDALTGELSRAVAELEPRRTRIPLYTTALDDPRDQAPRDGAYWAGNLRNPVRFAEAALADGHRAFLEVSAHPVVSHSIADTAAAAGIEVHIAHSLRRGTPERETLLVNLAGLQCVGVPVDWSARIPDGHVVALPPIAWQRRSHWALGAVENRSGPQHDVDDHTLLGARIAVNSPTPVHVWQTSLDMDCRPYPGDHPVKDVEIIPAAVLLNTFFTAGRDVLGLPDGERPVLSDVRLRVPVSVTKPRDLQVIVQDAAISLASCIAQDDGAPGDRSDGAWLTHTSATIARGPGQPARRTLDPAAIAARCPESLGTRYVQERLAGLGVAAMGFPWEIKALRRGPGELFAEVAVCPDPQAAAQSWAGALDAALSIGSVVFEQAPVLRMPTQITEARLTAGPCADRALISVRARPGEAGQDTVDLDITGPDGTVGATLSGLRYGVLEGGLGAGVAPARLVHEVRLLPSTPTPDTPPERIVVVGDPQAAARLARYFAELDIPADAIGPDGDLRQAAAAGPGTAILVLAPPVEAGGAVGPAATAATWTLTRAAAALAGPGGARGARLWCLTRGVSEACDDTALAHAPLWGLGRVLAGEHPEVFAAVLDVEAGCTDAAAAALLRPLLGARPPAPVVALRGGESLIERLAPVANSAVRPDLTCRPEGTYLVTGGLGVLGLEIAAWLADRGACRLVLAGRTPLPPREDWDSIREPQTARIVAGLQDLEARGVSVRTVALDIADYERAAAVLDPAALGLPPILGVVHAAGVLDNRMAVDVDEDSLRRVLRPKVGGALALGALFPPGSLDFLVLFSSCGHLLGLPGQAAYGSANAFLDAFARSRRRHGHTDTVSLAWTSWRGLGMSTSSAVIDAELAARGTGDVTKAEALRCWEFAQRSGGGHYVVLRVLPDDGSPERCALLENLAQPGAAPAAAAQEEDWRGLEPGKLEDFLVGEVVRRVAQETRLSTDGVDARRPLAELGVDSVMTVVIRRGLERFTRLPLPATLLWEYPSSRARGGLPGRADPR
ncbi:MAG TPA: beta-ketoacyl synthase N-terminal-like domain-containing protein [Actinocrinis sp.]